MNQTIAGRSALFWFLQRITGLVLAFFLLTHIKVLHLDFDFSKHGLIDFAFVIERLKASVAWGIFYFLFVLSALFHGLNGLWGIVMDFRPSPLARTIWLAFIWVFGLLVTAWSLSTLWSFYQGGGV